MSAVLFFIAAIGAITGAIGVVLLRNPFYSVLALAFHLVSLAALFLLLRAEFVAASQVIVYAGAVMVLYVFVVAYVGGMEGPLAVGAVILPRRRAGVPDTGEVSVSDVMRSRDATLTDHPPETMLEAGGPPQR